MVDATHEVSHPMFSGAHVLRSVCDRVPHRLNENLYSNQSPGHRRAHCDVLSGTLAWADKPGTSLVVYFAYDKLC